MSASLIETLGASLTPELLNSIGKLTGEPSGAIGKVLGAALPTILSSIAGGAQQPGFLEKILGMANQVAGQGSLLPKLGTIIAQGTLPAPLLAIGEKLLALLFGNKADALAGALASLGGVRSSSATTLLGLAAPMVLGALGDKVRSSGLNAMGLASLLGNEQKSFAALVPQGLLGVLGSGAATAAATGVAAKITGIGQGTHAPAPQAHAAPIATAAAHTHSHAPAAAHATTTHTVSTPAARPAAAAASPAIPHHHAASGGSRLGSLAMWWALLGLMGAGIWYWYMHSPVGLPKVAVTAPAAKVEAPAVKVEAPAPAAPKVEAPAVKVEAPKVEAPKIEAPAVKVEAPKVEAPAVKVEAPKVAAPAWSFAPSLTEGRMIEFIQDGSRAVDKTTWFDFPEITFETASAELTGAAKAQVGRIHEVLKAYPAVALKIGGYTDNTGDPDRNLKLSDNRAKAVMAALVAMGAARARLEAEGYGPQFPVASNDTEEGRAKNRRISLRVTNK